MNIKKIALYFLLMGMFAFSSCSMFELDNYDAPSEILSGEVIDVETGELVLTDQGSEGIRVRLTEVSWGENVTPNTDFYCMPDGTFNNSKLFKGTYNIRIDGPFIPLLREDENGVPIADETKTLEIDGNTNVVFEVQPFLKVEWVSEPTVSNGKITAKIRVKRAVTEDEFQTKIEPLGSYSSSFLNVTDVQLFVSYSSTVGYRARDERWSNKIEYVGSAFTPLLGTPITIQSLGEIPSGQIVFVRAASRINYDTPVGSGTRRWNYSEPLEIVIP